MGTATLNECVQIAGWIARSVRFPVILDGDTGHGGIIAVRRMIEDCIREGIAGVRIDDQPIEGKRGAGAWVDFRELHKENPYLSGALKIGGVEVAKQRELEEKYLTWDSLEKYERSPGRNPS